MPTYPYHHPHRYFMMGPMWNKVVRGAKNIYKKEKVLKPD